MLLVEPHSQTKLVARLWHNLPLFFRKCDRLPMFKSGVKNPTCLLLKYYEYGLDFGYRPTFRNIFFLTERHHNDHDYYDILN